MVATQALDGPRDRAWQRAVSRRLYMIAGEPSGDRLGGGLMQAFAGMADVSFHGVGGREMTAAGLEPLFEMSELSVMGLAEVLPRLPRLVRRIRQTAADVVRVRPEALVTIDSPDFGLRVARLAKRSLPDLPVIHYVAPSVWAWRPGRAVRMARHVDHVLALLPFEPPYMQAAGMSCDFVGHPAAALLPPAPEEVAAFRRRNGLEGRRLLLLAPGSRRGEIARLMPIYLQALERLRRDDPALGVICPLAETVEPEVRAALSALGAPLHAIAPGAPAAERRIAMAAADAALCTSGTITLEAAALGVPMVAAYRTSWATAAIVRRMVRVGTANLVNLVVGRNAVPEYLQDRCTAPALAEALHPLLTNPAAGSAQRAAFEEAMSALGRGGPPPSERAATSVLQFLEKRRTARSLTRQ